MAGPCCEQSQSSRKTAHCSNGLERADKLFTHRNNLPALKLDRLTSNGCAGLAHLLEHMAFKGTRRVGGKDWKKEGPLLDAQDEGG